MSDDSEPLGEEGENELLSALVEACEHLMDRHREDSLSISALRILLIGKGVFSEPEFDEAYQRTKALRGAGAASVEQLLTPLRLRLLLEGYKGTRH
jgi:hypothetical protein